MLEVLQFIFSGFWIWLGTVGLVCALGSALADIIQAARGERDA
jgi:hypothetical protein